MAIPIVEPIIWRQLPIDDPANMRDAVIQALLDAGWTEDANGAIALPYSILTVSGLPNNDGTITVGSMTYTWKTALTNSGNTPYEVLIGSGAASSAANILSFVRSAISSLSN